MREDIFTLQQHRGLMVLDSVASKSYRRPVPPIGWGRVMLKRRAFLCATLSLGFAPLVAEAQAPGKVWHVAVLVGALPRSAAPVRALEQRLAELGYAQGRNLLIEFRTAEGQNERLPWS